MDNLLSGLVGAVIGSLFGFAGAMVVVLHEQRERRRGAARAIMAECYSNKLAADSAVLMNGEFPFSSAIYQLNLPLIAASLKESELGPIQTPYTYLPSCERIRQSVLDEVDVDVRDLGTLRFTSERFDAAIAILGRMGGVDSPVRPGS